ncbi:metallophosphoesterase [Roseateles sp.]|uniref:metallophosphoesterase n=1 Tax=Roseateles sp. TaxID=1971397 RepID=UPI0031E3737C
MRLLVLSDIHLERGTSLTVPPTAHYDVVVLAGDIHNPGSSAVHWAARESMFCGRPVVYVPGNHEFYGKELTSELAEMRKGADGTNVHVLNRDAVVIDGVRFLGATLWTDFELPVGNEGEPVDYQEETDVARALAAANRYVMDFRAIQLEDPPIRRHRRENVKHRTLRAEDTLAMHYVDRDWLRRELEAGHAGPTVVVTHHAPHRRSVAKRYRSDWVTPAFVSDLPESFFGGESMWVKGVKHSVGGPALWIHGHTHTAFDYQVGKCRVVSNPRGYRMRDSSWENAHFDPGFVVGVAETPAFLDELSPDAPVPTRITLPR